MGQLKRIMNKLVKFLFRDMNYGLDVSLRKRRTGVQKSNKCSLHIDVAWTVSLTTTNLLRNVL